MNNKFIELTNEEFFEVDGGAGVLAAIAAGAAAVGKAAAGVALFAGSAVGVGVVVVGAVVVIDKAADALFN